MNQLTKIKEREFRGLTFLPSGQSFSGWLPAGFYAFGNEVELPIGWTRPGEYFKATEAYDVRFGHKVERWYLASSILAEGGAR